MSELYENLAGAFPEAETDLPGSALFPPSSAQNLVHQVNLDQLTALDRIIATTRNSQYEVIVISPGTANVIVRGGAYFPEFTPARLDGSLLGVSSIKTRSVTVGLRIEFTAPGDHPVITTPVRWISVIPSAGSKFEV
jgi:hypothetical protein